MRTLVATLLLAALPLVAAAQRPYAEQSADTRRVAEQYFAAYIARDWDRLEPLLAEGGSFSDPTAQAIFGKVDDRGKPAVMKKFREGYAGIRHMQFAPIRSFFSGEHAVFEGALDWTLALASGKQAVTTGMPFLTILRIDAGQVVEHRDLADYQPFLEAVRAAKGAAG